MISEATARDLELPSLLAVVAELGATDLGRDRILGLGPFPSRKALDAHRSLFAEVGELLEEGPLVPELEEPLAPVMYSLRTGRGQLGGQELVRLGSLLGVIAELRQRLADLERPAPLLEEQLGLLAELEPLRRRITSTLTRRGGVRDDASPRLVSLRRSIRRDRDQLHEQLGGLVQARREVLSEDTITQRDGRLVVVLKAGSRGRIPGLVHGRSGSGQSYYFEPLETVEANNALQSAQAEEQEERARILRELIDAAREQIVELEATCEQVAELDLLQASVRFAKLVEGRQIEIAESPRFELRGARHPLLEPRLGALREAALGHHGHRDPVVPLELSIEAPQRALVITGPNAGGKTVALKTLGLLAVAAHCGLPVPVAEGSRLPHLGRVVAAIGDEQDLLADRSTFSGRLLRLREAWQEAGPRTLVLLDELGSGTDPEEGAALATAALEGLLDRGCFVVVTTHLTRLAAAALDLASAGCAAMEFDAAGGQPTYRLEAGAPGGSEALALARRLGLPEALVDAAEARLSGEHRDLRRLLAEVESLRSELAAERDRLRREREKVDAERAGLEEKQEALEKERELVGRRMRSELESFRVETRKRLEKEVERLREELEAGRRRELPARAVARLFEQAPVSETPPKAEAAPEVGQAVRHRTLGWRGLLEKLDRGRAEVKVKGKRLRCRIEELAAEGDTPAPRPRSTSIADAAGGESPRELHLLGQTVEEALQSLDLYLDRALLGSFDELRVVHGHGTGRLREAVRAHLRRHPAVAEQRPGRAGEGGDGATVLRLRS